MKSNYKHFLFVSTIILVSFSLIGIYCIILYQSWGPAFGSKTFRIVDRHGDPVGEDFVYFYAASLLVAAGKPATVYDPDCLREEVEKLVGKKINYDWWYPPTFLLMVAPLVKMSYLTALLGWVAITFMGYFIVLLRIAPHPLTVLLTLAFPGTLVNITCGQNGFLSAAFLGGGLLSMEKRPWVGGALLGLLTYKPHLAILIPLSLAASRRWQALGAFCLAAFGLIVASTVVFGYEPWIVFLTNLLRPAYKLEIGSWPWEKMPTVFAAVFLSGGNLLTARLVQGLVSTGVAAAIAWAWYRDLPSPNRNAALILGILLFTPYAFYYDFALMALPIAWLGWNVYRNSWEPGEEIILAILWFTPLLMYLFINVLSINFPLSPLCISVLFLLSLKRKNESPF